MPDDSTCIIPAPTASAALLPDLRDAADFARATKAAGTQQAYRSAWRDFQAYCGDRGVTALPAPPATVIAYISRLAKRGIKPSTIQVRIAAIALQHKLAHLPDPTHDEDVKAVLAGIRRKVGVAPQRKAPVAYAELTQLIEALPGDLRGVRDKALILLGFAGAFRRSELVGLDVGHVRFGAKAMTLTVKHSKTDQEGAGIKKTIPYLADAALDPAFALKAWLRAAGITRGPIFRKVDRWGKVGATRLNDRVVALTVKRAAQCAGLPADQFSGHSLRAGFITSAATAGVPEWKIQEVSGHKSERVLRGYIRDAGLGGQDAVRGAFGLSQ